MDTDLQLIVLRRWRRTHRHVDYEYLYKSFQILLNGQIRLYPAMLHHILELRAQSLFIEALHKFNPKKNPTLTGWIASWLKQLGRLANTILHPGIPENRITKTASDKRKMLKAGGWRRQDFAGTGERWFGPNTISSIGVSLDTAWKNFHRRPRGVFGRIPETKALCLKEAMQSGEPHPCPEDLKRPPKKKRD